MKIKIKLLTQMKEYLPDSDLPGNTRAVEVGDGAAIRQVLSELGLPEDTPKVILLNDRQGKLDDILKEGDTITVVPPVGGG
jgi:sulfur carrier protein ThiS